MRAPDEAAGASIATLFLAADEEAAVTTRLRDRSMVVINFPNAFALVNSLAARDYDAVIVEDTPELTHDWLSGLQASVTPSTSTILLGEGGARAIARALMHGVDDYVTMIDGPDGLVERLRARVIVKRGSKDRSLLRVGGYELDMQARSLASSGHQELLTTVECRLARLLFDNDGRTVSVERLVAAASEPPRVVARRALEQRIYRLRKKFEAVSVGQDTRLQIEAAYGAGYRLLLAGPRRAGQPTVASLDSP